MVFGNTLFQRFVSDRLGRDGIRVEKFPRVHYIENSRRDSKDDDKVKSVNQSHSKEGSSSCQCTMILIGKARKQRKLYCECSQSYRVCTRIHARTLVVLGAWIGEDMVRNSCLQTWWWMEQNCWRHDAQLCRKRTSCISCEQRLGKRRIEKRRKRSKIHSLQR